MTIAEMISERTEKLSAIKDSSNAAVTAKGGTAAGDISGLPAAIASIPSGGALPELTDPAAAGEVIAGKEYIDGAGAKRTGTLVVCDTVGVVETVGSSGVGVNVEIESTADGSTAILTLPETNLLPENIKRGVNIFGVPGTARKLRVETGTITPAEDMIDITIPAPFDGYCAMLLTAVDRSALEAKGANSTYSVRVMNALNDSIGAIGVVNRYNGSTYSAATTFPVEDENGNMNIINATGRFFRAGIVYNYYVYYWEDT